MANAVVGETSPNYFKEILQFLYPHFGNAQQYNLEVILPQFKSLTNPEKDKIKSLVAIMFKQNLIINTQVGEKSYQLNIQGFEFCQKYYDYVFGSNLK